MQNKNLVVIKSKMFINDKQLNGLHKSLCKQLESGIVVVPSWCDVTYVQGDVEVKLCENNVLGDREKGE